MIERMQRKFSSYIEQYFVPDDIRKTFSLLMPYMLRYWRPNALLFLLLGVDVALTLVFAWFYGSITDAAIHGDITRLLRLVALGVALLIVSIFTAYFNVYLDTVATNGVKNNLKTDLYKRILLLPAAKHFNLRSGDLISHFTNDIHSIDGVIGRSFIELIKLPVIYLAVFIYLLQIHWKLAVLGVLAAPFALAIGAVFGLLLRRNSRLINELLGNMNGLLNETFQGFMMIRSFSIERWLFGKFAAQNRELFALELQNARLRGKFLAGGDAISTLIFLASLCFGAYFISRDMLTVGSLLTFVNLIDHMIYPLTGLAAQWAGFQRSVSAVERISRVMQETPESPRLPYYIRQAPAAVAIDVNNIAFSYDGRMRIFDRFDMHIPAGKVVAIVGQSGAGKTTLFNLLQGFFKPEEGAIWIDGRPADSYSSSELRSRFAYVPQETFLFDGTVRENLSIARPDIAEAEMREAAAAANIHDFICAFPDGYDTEIGERGLRLSGGQKQRLAIARAILKDAPILLLDEATSALDNESEHEVKEALDRLMQGRTTIVIAHRLSTIRHADLIIVLDKGKIVQQGNHEELMETDGLYRQLYQREFQKTEGADAV